MLQKSKLLLLRFILLYVVVLTSSGFDNKRSEELILPIDSTRSTQLACYYKDIKINSDVTELKLPEKYNKQTRSFNQQEVKIPVKGENFLSPYVGKNVHYYELGYFTYKENTYRLIIYNKIGEADTLLLNLQINSYDAKNDLVDALLLSSFFGYEDIVRFSDFVIQPDYTINIDNYVIYKYEENEYGVSDKLIKNPTPQVYLKEKYQIENGRFKLIFRSETSRGKMSQEKNKIKN
ncbi:hypothetical protein CSAG_00871 [Citrobacter portucalensis]|uniref:hypothetical protein n=1 Tax=Citrobacter portucalensis TaxID=1639133 RepID=UPI00019B0AB0|nr:hypothetical protein [Citrobacter portucalensis]ECE6307481.1 hypothetical protein [Salmonella enterica subsp. enterica]EEH92517.1 hypothetical protein CSAG_00871 [Citrobacter portucalensis]EHU7519176.1 hypothetical protein [Salmonella enterica]EHW1663108.1 hypothetical protein [Salmonella enterica]